MSSQPIRNASGQFYRILSQQEVADLSHPAFRSYQLWLAHEQSKLPPNPCGVCGSAVEVPGWLECRACHSQVSGHQARMQVAKDVASCGIVQHHPDGSAERIDPASVHRARSVPAMHPDEVAVRSFAEALVTKMALSRAKGRSGWNDPAQCPSERLQELLRGHLLKGDPVDVALFCMMLWMRGLQVVAP